MSQEKEVRKDERNLFTFLIVFLLVKTKKKEIPITQQKIKKTKQRPETISVSFLLILLFLDAQYFSLLSRLIFSKKIQTKGSKGGK